MVSGNRRPVSRVKTSTSAPVAAMACRTAWSSRPRLVENAILPPTAARISATRASRLASAAKRQSTASALANVPAPVGCSRDRAICVPFLGAPSRPQRAIYSNIILIEGHEVNKNSISFLAGDAHQECSSRSAAPRIRLAPSAPLQDRECRLGQEAARLSPVRRCRAAAMQSTRGLQHCGRETARMEHGDAGGGSGNRHGLVRGHSRRDAVAHGAGEQAAHLRNPPRPAGRGEGAHQRRHRHARLPGHHQQPAHLRGLHLHHARAHAFPDRARLPASRQARAAGEADRAGAVGGRHADHAGQARQPQVHHRLLAALQHQARLRQEEDHRRHAGQAGERDGEPASLAAASARRSPRA